MKKLFNIALAAQLFLFSIAPQGAAAQYRGNGPRVIDMGPVGGGPRYQQVDPRFHRPRHDHQHHQGRGRRGGGLDFGDILKGVIIATAVIGAGFLLNELSSNDRPVYDRHYNDCMEHGQCDREFRMSGRPHETFRIVPTEELYVTGRSERCGAYNVIRTGVDPRSGRPFRYVTTERVCRQGNRWAPPPRDWGAPVPYQTRRDFRPGPQFAPGVGNPPVTRPFVHSGPQPGRPVHVQQPHPGHNGALVLPGDAPPRIISPDGRRAIR